MGSGRIYTDKITVGSVDIFEVTSDPSGSLQATQGSLAIRSDTAETYQNINGASGWVQIPFSVIKQRIQLAGLPAAATTGTVLFGPTILANQVVTGASVSLNQDVNVGATGITNVNLTVGAVGSNLITALELVGVTGAPKYLSTFNTNVNNWRTGFFADPASGQMGIEITSTGGNLNTLTAFDLTVFLFVSPVVLSAP